MEAIPVVDLRLLTQAEINALSRVCSSAPGDPRLCDDVVVPKIDRSVFNESAGSRKQTYSRLRLAPRKPPELSASPSSSTSATRGRRRAGGTLHPPPGSSAQTSSTPPLPSQQAANDLDDPCRRENEQIILFLRQLFAKKGIKVADKAVAPDESAAIPKAEVGDNPKSVGSGLGKRGRDQGLTGASGNHSEFLKHTGMNVDLVRLGKAEDPFGAELRRRTQGLMTEEDFLRFLSGLEGQWGSRRKRRRIVDADKLGDALPMGWKVLLALKRKDGNIWIHCRRYISPSGKQFMSCKEAASYLLSSTGSPKIREQSTTEENAQKLGNGYVVSHVHQVNVTSPRSGSHAALPSSAFLPDAMKQVVVYGAESSANSLPQEVLRCVNCNVNFSDKGAHMQHLLTHHRTSRKKRRAGQSITDGVIIRDGKYECQFCHKIFTERHRYNGHVGIHVKYLGKRLEQVEDEITAEKSGISSTEGVAPAVPQHNNLVDHGKEAKLTEYNVNEQFRSGISSTEGVAPAVPQHNNLVDHEKEAKLTEYNVNEQFTYETSDNYPHSNEHTGNTVSDHTMKCCDNVEEMIMVQDPSYTGVTNEIKNNSPLRNTCDNEEKNVMVEHLPSSDHQEGDGSPGNSMLIQKTRGDQVMNHFENEKDATREVYEGQCKGETNASFSPRNNLSKVFSPELLSKVSPGKFLEACAGMVDQRPTDAAEAGNIASCDTYTQNSSGSSVIDIRNCSSEGYLKNDLSKNILRKDIEGPCEFSTNHGNNSIAEPNDGQASVELSPSSQSVVDNAEKSDNRIFPGSSHNILTKEFGEMVKYSNEPKSDIECGHATSDRAGTLENIMHGETQPFEIGENFLENPVDSDSDRKFSNVDSAINGMLPDCRGEVILEMMSHSSNSLNNNLISGSTVDATVQRNGSCVIDEGNLQNLQLNLQASWEQSPVRLPILQMITDQTRLHSHDRLHYANGDISCFEDMRLDEFDTQKLAGGNSTQQLDEPIVDGSGLGNGPCVHLDWDATFDNLIPGRRVVTVCVWCSVEFEHDDVDIEVQPDSVGFMCPTCKAKISGQM